MPLVVCVKNNETPMPKLLELITRKDGRILQWSHIPESQRMLIGDGDGCHFFVEGLPPTTLFSSDETSLRVSPALEPFLAPTNTGLLLRLPQGVELSLRRSPGVATPIAAPKRRREVSPYVVSSAVLHGLLLLLFFQVSPLQQRLTIEAPPSSNQYIKALIEKSEEKPEDIPTLWSEKMSTGLLGEREGTLHSGAAGIMGKKKARRTEGMYQIEGEARDPHLARQAAQSVASQTGILSLIKGGNAESSPFASVFGQDTMTGADAATILGGLYGYEHNEAEGGYGLGLRGAGIGGSYKGEGTLGAGSFEDRGWGAGGTCDATCVGMGLGRGAGTGSGVGISLGKPEEKERTHKASAPEATPGKATIRGGLSKDVIRRVIQRAMPGIKYCYEQALQKTSSLEGRVDVLFVITPNGAVVDAKSTSGIAPSVDQCVVQKIRKLAFPAPNEVVEVSYPFFFQSK